MNYFSSCFCCGSACLCCGGLRTQERVLYYFLCFDNASGCPPLFFLFGGPVMGVRGVCFCALNARMFCFSVLRLFLIFFYESVFRAFSRFFCGGFDSGSGRTLAACLTHASRTGSILSLLGVVRVANG